MSTSRPVRRCRRSESGLSVTELIIVTFIMGLLAVLVAAPLQMTNQLSKSSIERLVESSDAPASLRVFSSHFAGAQIARSPLITCDGISAAFKTDSIRAEDGRIRVMPQSAGDEFRRFSLPFSSASALGAIDPSTTNAIIVSEPGMFDKGDLVAVINAENSGVAGMFTIENKDDAGKLFLSDATNVQSGDCRLNQSANTTLSQLKSLAATKGMRNVIVLRFHIATYESSGDSLYVRVYPQTPDDKYTSQFAENFEMFDLTLQYQKRQAVGQSISSDDFEEVEGTLWATVNFVLLEYDQVRARQQKGCTPDEFKESKTQVCMSGRLFSRRTITNTMRFTLSGSKTLNPQVTTNTVSKQNIFPTCYIKAQEEGYAMTLPKKMQNCYTGGTSKLFRISGAVSEPGLGAINLNVGVTLKPNSKMCCMNAAELKALKDPDNPTKEEDIDLWKGEKDAANAAQDLAFPLNGTAASLDEMLCQIAGGAEMGAKMQFFDPGLMKRREVSCHENVNIFSPTTDTYRVVGAVGCTRTGACTLPSELQNVKTGETQIGAFYQEVSCSWSDQSKDRPCCTALPSEPGVELLNVNLVVSNILIDNKNALGASCQ